MVGFKLFRRRYPIRIGRVLVAMAVTGAGLLFASRSPVLADGLPNSGVADFYYFADTGALFVDTDQQNLVSMLVAGPPALSIDRFQDGSFDEGTQSMWVQQYFAGKEQWIATDDPPAVAGVFQIATYAAGLSAVNFGQVEYGTAESASVFTALTYHGAFLFGDFDFDGQVDLEDHQRWMSSFGSTNDAAADGNQDNVVDAADYTIWRKIYAPSSGGALAVPEPNALGAGLILLSTGVVAARWRPRRAVRIDSPLDG